MRTLSKIASEIRADWKNPSPYAKPYLDAMATLQSINDSYWYDSGRDVVLRFLCNASTWRGDKARAIKLELKELVGTAK